MFTDSSENNSFMDVSLSLSGKRSSASTLTRVRRKQSLTSAHFFPAAPVNAVRPSATCANAPANAARPSATCANAPANRWK